MKQEILKTKIIPSILAVIIVGLMVYFLFNHNADNKKEGLVPFPPEATKRTGFTSSELASARTSILKRVSKNKPLDDSEKEEIFEMLMGDKILFYGFTETEKNKIIEKLNS